jgi:hypothetical protein
VPQQGVHEYCGLALGALTVEGDVNPGDVVNQAVCFDRVHLRHQDHQVRLLPQLWNHAPGRVQRVLDREGYSRGRARLVQLLGRELLEDLCGPVETAATRILSNMLPMNRVS